eukprot:1317209-Amorphochlora_amoeboformis.AAC.1
MTVPLVYGAHSGSRSEELDPKSPQRPGRNAGRTRVSPSAIPYGTRVQRFASTGIPGIRENCAFLVTIQSDTCGEGPSGREGGFGRRFSSSCLLLSLSFSLLGLALPTYHSKEKKFRGK